MDLQIAFPMTKKQAGFHCKLAYLVRLSQDQYRLGAEVLDANNDALSTLHQYVNQSIAAE